MAGRTMPSSRSPNDSSQYSARPLRTFRIPNPGAQVRVLAGAFVFNDLRRQRGPPRPLFQTLAWNTDANYDVSPDGSFVMLTKPSAELSEINVILNWLSELEQFAPTN